MEVANKSKFKIIIVIIILVIVIISGCKSQLEDDQNPIAKTENGNTYVLDNVDVSKHPFAFINLNSGKVNDIKDRLNDELITELINAAKNFLLNKKGKEESTNNYTALSSIEINSVIVDSEKSAKVTARLNYINLDKDPNAIEEIPIIIDDKITTLPYSSDSNKRSTTKIDHYKDVCLYIYYKENKFHVLEEVTITD